MNKAILFLLTIILFSTTVFAQDTTAPLQAIYLGQEDDDSNNEYSNSYTIFAKLWNGDQESTIDSCQIAWDGENWEEVSVGPHATLYNVGHSYQTHGTKIINYSCTNSEGLQNIGSVEGEHWSSIDILEDITPPNTHIELGSQEGVSELITDSFTIHAKLWNNDGESNVTACEIDWNNDKEYEDAPLGIENEYYNTEYTFETYGEKRVNYRCTSSGGLSEGEIEFTNYATITIAKPEIEFDGELIIGGESQVRSNPLQSPDPTQEIAQGTIKITNTGGSELNQITIKSISVFEGFDPQDFDFQSELSSDALDLLEEGTITVSSIVPAYIDAVDSNAIAIATEIGTIIINATGPDGEEIKASTLITLHAENKLVIKNGDVTVDGDRESTSNGDRISNVKPGSHVELEIEIENLFSRDSNIEMEDVLLIVENADLEVDEEDEVSDIRYNSEETGTISFDIPEDTEEGTYPLLIIVSATDDNGARHGQRWIVDIEVERESHEIIIKRLSTFPSVVACQDTVEVNGVFRNTGKSDEDYITLRAVAPDFGYDRDITDIELEVDDEVIRTFSIDVEGYSPGTYTVNVYAYYDENEESDSEDITFSIERCTVVGGSGGSSSGSASDNSPVTVKPINIASPQIPDELEIVEVREKNNPVTIGIAGIVILIILILLAVLVILLFKSI